MQQYLITAYDFTYPEAINRRMTARPAHLDNVRRYKQSGNFIIGGAILSPEGKMIGSSVIIAFETEADLQKYIAEDPYTTQQVWDKVEVRPFRVAEV